MHVRLIRALSLELEIFCIISALADNIYCVDVINQHNINTYQVQFIWFHLITFYNKNR